MSREKKRFRIRFEISVTGLFGLTLVTFCIFLWMFLLGVWAGQLVLPADSTRGVPLWTSLSSWWQPNGEGAGGQVPKRPEVIEAPMLKKPAAVAEPVPELKPVSLPELDLGLEMSPDPEPPPEPAAVAQPEPGPAAGSFFSLQVAAYSEADWAEQAVVRWQERGFEVFLLRPVDGDILYRVCVGKYEHLADANREAERLEETDGLRAFITLIAAGRPQ